jgi:hypothetical protein
MKLNMNQLQERKLKNLGFKINNTFIDDDNTTLFNKFIELKKNKSYNNLINTDYNWKQIYKKYKQLNNDKNIEIYKAIIEILNRDIIGEQIYIFLNKYITIIKDETKNKNISEIKKKLICKNLDNKLNNFLNDISIKYQKTIESEFNFIKQKKHIKLNFNETFEYENYKFNRQFTSIILTENFKKFVLIFPDD